MPSSDIRRTRELRIYPMRRLHGFAGRTSLPGGKLPLISTLSDKSSKEKIMFRKLNSKYSRLIRDGEAKIREFAERHKLPIIIIERLVRPVIGSGLWDPIPFLIGDDDDEWYELDKSSGLGHIARPHEASIGRAFDLLTSIMESDHLSKTWDHTRHIDCFSRCRDGAMIIAANQLEVPMRHFDAGMVGVELFLPSPNYSRRKRRQPSKV